MEEVKNVNPKEKLNEKDVIYMVLTDRFFEDQEAKEERKDPEWRKNHPEYNPEMLKFYNGGTWKGLLENLDYIQSLGVTAIWISPVSKNEVFNTTGNAIIANKLNDPEYKGDDGGIAWQKAMCESKDALEENPNVETGFHGYFTKNYDEANEYFGSKEDLKNLADAIHKRGMKLILDVVPNHTADYYVGGEKKLRFPNLHAEGVYDNPDFYHHNGMIGNDDWASCMEEKGQKNIEEKDLGGLDDLAQEKEFVRDAIINSYQNWMKLTDADGLRVDAARCMPKEFLDYFEKEMGVPTFGEVFEFNPKYVASFQKKEERKGMWGCLDFPLFMAMRHVFAENQNVEQLAEVFNNDNLYGNPNHLVTFLDNHDRDRFLCVAKDNYQNLRLALAFLFLCRGIPQIYYGTEQALYGGDSPSEGFGIANKYNREMMPVDSFTPFKENSTSNPLSKTPELFRYIRKLTDIRKKYECLQTGSQYEMWVDYEQHRVFAFSRMKENTDEEIITIVNTGKTERELTIPIRKESKLVVNTVLKNLINVENTDISYTIEEGKVTGKQIKITIPAKTIYALVPSSLYADFNFYELKPLKTVIRVRCVGVNVNWMKIKGYPYPLFGDCEQEMTQVGEEIWEFETERLTKGQEYHFKIVTHGGDGKAIYSAETYKAEGGKVTEISPAMLYKYVEIP